MEMREKKRKEEVEERRKECRTKWEQEKGRG